jgi:segregation and condensation protein B
MANQESSLAALEALLFIHGESITKKKIMAVLGLDPAGLEEALGALRTECARPERGLMLLVSGDKVQLVTKPVWSGILAQFVKEELQEELTPAALEALSLIVYLGPLQRARLDYLRGVNSSFIVRNLMLRGLVERFPDPSKPSLFLYQATTDTLRHLGVGRPEDLPEYERFREIAAWGTEAASGPGGTAPAS